MFPLSLPPLHSYWPFATTASGRAPAMSVTYFKRYRMEFNLRRRTLSPIRVPEGYRLAPWSSDLVEQHAETKYQSFRGEIDAGIFHALGELSGCYELMEGISSGLNFVPEATWLVEHVDPQGNREYCGTIQGVKANATYGAIQNVGVVPAHRGRGLGATLVNAALTGFQQIGLPRAYLEVTVQNKSAVQLYQRLGFRRTKTIYKSVEMAYS